MTVPNSPACEGDGTRDEDVVSEFPSLTTSDAGNTYSVNYTASGASRRAEVCAWIDFNGNGTFDDAERRCNSRSLGQVAEPATWTVPADIVAGETYARFRIGYDITATQSPTAALAGGETEDYAITVADGEADGENEPQAADDVSVDADEARPVTVEIIASDPDHDTGDLTHTVGTGPVNGSVDGEGPEFTYTSEAGFSGTDSFTVEVCDPDEACDTATVSVDVAAFAPPAAPPADAGELTVDPDSVAAGEKVTVSGNGMRPGETAFLVLHSDPTRVGEATADDNGDFSSEVTIPDGAEPGGHALAAYGEDTALAAALTVTVDENGGTGGGNGGTGGTGGSGGGNGNDAGTGGGDGTGAGSGKKLAFTGAADIPLLIGVGSALFLAGCGWLLAARRTRHRNAG